MLNILLLPTLKMNFYQCELLLLLGHIWLTASTIVQLIYIVVNGEPTEGAVRNSTKSMSLLLLLTSHPLLLRNNMNLIFPITIFRCQLICRLPTCDLINANVFQVLRLRLLIVEHWSKIIEFLSWLSSFGKSVLTSLPYRNIEEQKLLL